MAEELPATHHLRASEHGWSLQGIRSPDPCLMWVCKTCMCVWVCVCVTSTIVAHLRASLQGLRMCHIKHRPVNKSGELGSPTVCVCVSIHLQAGSEVCSKEGNGSIYVVSVYAILKILSPHCDYSWVLCMCAVLVVCSSCVRREKQHVVKSVVRVNYDRQRLSSSAPRDDSISISVVWPTNMLINLKFQNNARKQGVFSSLVHAEDKTWSRSQCSCKQHSSFLPFLFF